MYYDWKNTGRKDIGFTAQDLLKTQEQLNMPIPDLVITVNPEEYGVTYTKLIPILVKAVQELNNQVQELKGEIEVLKQK